VGLVAVRPILAERGVITLGSLLLLWCENIGEDAVILRRRIVKVGKSLNPEFNRLWHLQSKIGHVMKYFNGRMSTCYGSGQHLYGIQDCKRNLPFLWQ
jgi:hypothetical protein